MGLFSGIGDAPLFDRGVYIKPGFIGTLEVKRTIAKKTLKSGIGFIVEFEVINSNMEEHPVGSKATWFQKMSDMTVALPAIKAFAAALSGYELHNKEAIEAEVAPELEEQLDIAVADEDGTEGNNPFVGLTINLQTESTKTSKGFDFTRHNWSPA